MRGFVGLRLSEDERVRVERAAFRDGMALSTWIREVIMREAGRALASSSDKPHVVPVRKPGRRRATNE